MDETRISKISIVLPSMLGALSTLKPFCFRWYITPLSIGEGKLVHSRIISLRFINCMTWLIYQHIEKSYVH
jgi:hypothetical protein